MYMYMYLYRGSTVVIRVSTLYVLYLVLGLLKMFEVAIMYIVRFFSQALSDTYNFGHKTNLKRSASTEPIATKQVAVLM